MLTDIEIAQSTPMKPIGDIAKTAGVAEEYLEYYGRYKAKIDYRLLNETQAPNGKLILVTAINPTPPARVRPPPRWVWPTLCAAWARTLWWPCASPLWALYLA